MIRFLVIGVLLLAWPVSGQNITNFYTGQTITNGLQFTSVASGGGSGNGTNEGTGTEWLTVSAATPNAYAAGYTYGCGFTVGSSNLTVTALGCYVFEGTTQVRKLSMWTSSEVLLCTISLNPAGLSAGMHYEALVTNVTLTAGASYYFGLYRTNVDSLLKDSSSYSASGVTTSFGSRYGTGDACPEIGSWNNNLNYGGVSFKYASP